MDNDETILRATVALPKPAAGSAGLTVSARLRLLRQIEFISRASKGGKAIPVVRQRLSVTPMRHAKDSR